MNDSTKHGIRALSLIFQIKPFCTKIDQTMRNLSNFQLSKTMKDPNIMRKSFFNALIWSLHIKKISKSPKLYQSKTKSMSKGVLSPPPTTVQWSFRSYQYICTPALAEPFETWLRPCQSFFIWLGLIFHFKGKNSLPGKWPDRSVKIMISSEKGWFQIGDQNDMVYLRLHGNQSAAHPV